MMRARGQFYAERAGRASARGLSLPLNFPPYYTQLRKYSFRDKPRERLTDE